MTPVTREKTVLFLTNPGDPLAGEFALAIAREFVGRATNLSFFYAGVDAHSSTDWCVAWVRDDNGQVQAWLDHLPSGQHHWLGADPQKAIKAACRIIREWDKLEAGHTEALAVQ